MWLNRYTENDIYYSRHIKEDKFETGKVNEEAVRKNLLNPANLVQSVEMEALSPETAKFKLRFKLSRSKDLGVVVELNEKLKVITAYEILKAWQEKIGWKELWKEK